VPEAYENCRSVPQFQHYGERMAIYWLDMVRFAEYAGYHRDNHRDVTLFRDYVNPGDNDNNRSPFTLEQVRVTSCRRDARTELRPATIGCS